MKGIVNKCDTPPHALCPVVRLSPRDMIGHHKPIRTATKLIMKQTDGRVITPAEKSVRNERVICAEERATITREFSYTNSNNITINGAYVTDPWKLLMRVVKNSKWIAIGGDVGGSVMKLGVTHTHASGVTSFLPLLIYDGDERYETLSLFNNPILTFDGVTHKQRLHSIWAIFNRLITKHGAILNGDMKFICTVLGHGGASSMYPCPLCLVRIRQYTSDAKLRSNIVKGRVDTIHSVSVKPLIRIHPTRVVPLPLHIYLGIGNIVFNELMVTESSQVIVDALVAQLNIKSRKDREGGGGKSDVHGFTGPELHKLSHSQFPLIVSDALHRLGVDEETVKRVKERATILQQWMLRLEHYLLTAGHVSRQLVTAFSMLIEDILTRMPSLFGRHLTPKMHMLRHAVQFISNNKVLGSVSESQLESMHARMNGELVENRNTLHMPAEQLRRALADTLESSVKKYVLP